MRLFDKVLTQSPDRDHVREAFARESGVVLAIDPIAAHYAESKQQVWTNADFPYSRPPWRVCFVEWNTPPRLLTPDGWQDSPGPSQMGAVCIEGPVNKNTKTQIDDIPERSQVFVRINPVSYACGQLVPRFASVVVFMTDDGTITGFSIVGEPDRIAEGDVICKQLGGSIAAYVEEFMNPICLAFTFANCSNVKLMDATAELEPAPKIRRRLKIPEIKRYTLNICGHAAKASRESETGTSGLMPFHLCRGHFATYTEDRPMFGNPKLVGRFWHPQHMRGKKENGEIVKDYAIAE